jgi:hypothetical protein
MVEAGEQGSAAAMLKESWLANGSVVGGPLSAILRGEREVRPIR